MMLKPQDILVCLKLLSLRGSRWTYVQLSYELGLSASEANAAVRRLLLAGLARPPLEGEERPRPILSALDEFMIHGFRFAFPPERGEMCRGLPTGPSAEPLRGLVSAPEDPPAVWPFAEGTVRGSAFTPLYRSVPLAATRDANLYLLLALADALRDRSARVRKVARAKWEEVLGRHTDGG